MMPMRLVAGVGAGFTNASTSWAVIVPSFFTPVFSFITVEWRGLPAMNSSM